MPVYKDGIRKPPKKSVPIAALTWPVATRTQSPPEEPPGLHVLSLGLVTSPNI